MTGWLAALLNLVGLVLLGKRIAWGWLFGIAAECLWMVRAQSKGMPDLMFISAVYILVAGLNWFKWRQA